MAHNFTKKQNSNNFYKYIRGVVTVTGYDTDNDGAYIKAERNGKEIKIYEDAAVRDSNKVLNINKLSKGYSIERDNSAKIEKKVAIGDKLAFRGEWENGKIVAKFFYNPSINQENFNNTYVNGLVKAKEIVTKDGEVFNVLNIVDMKNIKKTNLENLSNTIDSLIINESTSINITIHDELVGYSDPKGSPSDAPLPAYGTFYRKKEENAEDFKKRIIEKVSSEHKSCGNNEAMIRLVPEHRLEISSAFPSPSMQEFVKNAKFYFEHKKEDAYVPVTFNESIIKKNGTPCTIIGNIYQLEANVISPHTMSDKQVDFLNEVYKMDQQNYEQLYFGNEISAEKYAQIEAEKNQAKLAEMKAAQAALEAKIANAAPKQEAPQAQPQQEAPQAQLKKEIKEEKVTEDEIDPFEKQKENFSFDMDM